jgi:hypothetical protein
MQVISSFVHLITYNIMVKIEFKMNMIWVSLIIFKNLYYVKLCDRCSGDVAFRWWYGIWLLVDNVDILHIILI